MKLFHEHNEDELREALLAQERALGRISKYSGWPVTLLPEYEDLDRSVRRLVDYLYEHDELTIDQKGVSLVGTPNLTQLHIDIQFLVEHGVCDAFVHNGKRYVVLTKYGEELVDDGKGAECDTY